MAVNVFNNTILVPTSGSSTNLDNTTIVSDLSKYANSKTQTEVLENQFTISLTSNGTTTKAGMCQRVSGLSVTRGVEKKRSGGEALYEMVLPGQISYGEVTFENLYTNSYTFLNWLINGAGKGGPLLADIEIKAGNSEGKMVYTLRDAFPIRWTIGQISVIGTDEVTKRKSSQAKTDQVPVEEVTVVYGKLEFTSE